MKNTYGPLSSKITLEQLHDLTKDFISSYCFKRNYKSELSLKNVIKCHVILSMMSLHRTSRPWSKRVTAFSNNFLWYSSTKYTDRPITQKSTPFLQNINVSQLCSSMVSGNFDNINGSEFLFPNQKLIYAFVNPLHRKLYIGQTKDLVSRFEQHLRESYKHKVLNQKTDRFHSFMAHNSYGSWCMIPIFLPTETQTEVDRIEKKMIKLFGDSTLNSQHVLIQRKYVLSQKFSNKQKSKSCINYSRSRHSKSKFVGNNSLRLPTQNPSCQFFNLTVTDPNNASCTTTNHYNLCKLLEQDTVKSCNRSNSVVKVNIEGNITVNTNWKLVRVFYGRTIIETGTDTMFLHSCIKNIKNGSLKSFIIKDLHTNNDEETIDFIRTLSTSSEYKANRLLKNIGFDDLYVSRSLTTNIHHRRQRELAQHYLDKNLKKKFNFSYTKPLTMKVMYSPTLSKNDIRNSAVKLIKSLNLPKPLALHFCRVLRIVFTKRQSIESILCDYRSLARNYDSAIPPTCICDQYPHLPRLNGHILFKGNESKLEYISNICSHNAKNIVMPHRYDIIKDLSRSFEVLFLNLTKSFNSSVANINQCDQSLLTDLISSANPNQSTRKSSSHYSMHTLPSTKTVKRLRKKLSGLVFSPLDKNTGALCIC